MIFKKLKYYTIKMIKMEKWNKIVHPKNLKIVKFILLNKNYYYFY